MTRPPFLKSSRRNPRPLGRDTRRWTVGVIVLIGSLGIYAAERWFKNPDAPVIGAAFVADGDTLTGAWVYPGGGYKTTSTRVK